MLPVFGVVALIIFIGILGWVLFIALIIHVFARR